MGKGWGSRSVPEQGRDTAGVEVGANGEGQRIRRLVSSLILVVGAFTGVGALAVASAAPAFAAALRPSPTGTVPSGTAPSST